MKTIEGIISDLYRVINGSELHQTITGDLLTEDRDIESTGEDIVISVIANTIGQNQMAFVHVNIYVLDVKVNPTNFKRNRQRIDELGSLSLKLFKNCNGSNFRFTNEGQSQLVIKVNGKNEHCISNRLLFTQINE